MRRAIAFALCAFGVTAFARGDNVIIDKVASIRTLQYAPTAARLVVFAVDDLGEPLAGATVDVISARKKVLSTIATSSTGAARFELSVREQVTVRVSSVGFTTAEARRVSLVSGRLTAVALPLELGPIKDAIFSKPK